MAAPFSASLGALAELILTGSAQHRIGDGRSFLRNLEIVHTQDVGSSKDRGDVGGRRGDPPSLCGFCLLALQTLDRFAEKSFARKADKQRPA